MTSQVPKPGDMVTLVELPPWVAGLAEESARVFRFCLGRTYPVSEIDEHGHLVLDVSRDVDPRFGGYMNDLRVEAEHVKLQETKAAKGQQPEGWPEGMLQPDGSIKLTCGPEYEPKDIGAPPVSDLIENPDGSVVIDRGHEDPDFSAAAKKPKGEESGQ